MTVIDPNFDVEKIFTSKCDVCGKITDELGWIHSDSWSKWLAYNYGTNTIYCSDCEHKVEKVRNEILDKNREEIIKEEIGVIQTLGVSELHLPYVLSHWYNDHECSLEFFKWVKSIIGYETTRLVLCKYCDGCDKLLGPPKYDFEDASGNCYIKTKRQLKQHLCNVLKIDRVKMGYRCQGDANIILHFITEKEDKNWSYGSSLSYNGQYLGKIRKDQGACVKIVQIDQSKNIWRYFCSRNCKEKSIGKEGSILL